jgi:hypothetical protein
MQRALLEMLLLGSAEKIIGGRSAFASCAGVLGGCDVIHPAELLMPQRYLEALLEPNDALVRSFSKEQVAAAVDRAADELCKVGDGERARALTELALAVLDEPPVLLTRMGHTNLYLRSAREAEPYFRRSLEQSSSVSALTGLVKSLASQGKADEARRLASQGCSDFHKSRALFDRAVVQVG